MKRNYLNFNFPHFISSIPKLHWRIITICIEFIGFHLKTLASNYRVQSLRFFKPIFIIHVSRNFPIKNVFCHLSLFSIINGYIFSNMSNYADTLYLFSPFSIRSSLCNDYHVGTYYILLTLYRQSLLVGWQCKLLNLSVEEDLSDILH